jgi:hypothetical protein
MTKSTKKREKLARPDAHFAEPEDVVVDSSLSTDEKFAALDSLELDARLLVTAASEGMSGGELNKLREFFRPRVTSHARRRTRKADRHWR